MLCSKDVKDIATFAVGGLLCGAIFQVANMTFKKRVGLRLTSVETESLHLDGTLNALFLQLEETVRELDEVAFLRAVDSADRLVFMRMLLHDKKVHPRAEDRVDAFLDFKKCTEELRILRNKIEETYPPKAAVDMVKSIDRIVDTLESHLSAVMLLTSEI
jgi:hypothetical protein